jgi:PAT family beta-lactamase induction signal transducer AmpG
LTARLGRRRSWLLLAQVGVVLGVIGMALADPRDGLRPLVACALLTAFASATQDVALDAWRIESAAVQEQAALAAMYQTGYRLAMIWAGAGALWIAGASDLTPDAVAAHCSAAGSGGGPGAPAAAGAADDRPWRIAYLVMAASMLPAIVTVLLAGETAPRVTEDPAGGTALPGLAVPLRPPSQASLASLAAWLRGAMVEPLMDFVRRYRWQALLLLALIAVYRISDVVMGIMANPFYVDMCYSRQEVAAISKTYGVVMTLAGAFVGGVVALRVGVMRTLFAGALLSAASNLLFAWLATRGHDPLALTLVVSVDNLAGGMASSAFIAYLSGLTNVAYSATQYALFSSVMLLLPKFVAGFSGVFVDRYGYQAFFVATAILGLPVLLLVVLAARARVVPAQGAGRWPANR